jgi:hypothetical protein
MLQYDERRIVRSLIKKRYPEKSCSYLKRERGREKDIIVIALILIKKSTTHSCNNCCAAAHISLAKEQKGIESMQA